MDPNSQQPAPQVVPQNQPTIPQSAPIMPIAPVQPQAAPVYMTPPAPLTPSFTTAKSNSKKLLPIIVGAVLLVIIAAGFGAYTLLFSASAQAKKASTVFMNAASAGDKEQLYAISDAKDEDDKAFLSHSADVVKGSYKLSKSTSQDNKWYYLYSLSGAERKYARTIVEKQDGKWGVSSFVYSDTELALIPGSSSANDSSAKVEEETSATADSSKCLVITDFDPWYQGLYKLTASEQGFKFHLPDTAYTSNTHFNADSFNVDDDNTSGISDMVALAKSISTKEFKIRLYGSVATTLKSDLDFANKRAQAVKDRLVASGVPADKIVIDPPSSVAAYGTELVNDEIAKRTARVVVLKLDPTCVGSPSTTSDSGR